MNSSASRSSNSDSNSNNSSNSSNNKHLKQQVKMVAGELENVLGELKTVVGDLRQLVTQIDEVTSKIDKEYGLVDAETIDKARRRLSTSVLETRPNRKNMYRLSGSQSFDLTQPGYQRECVSAAEIRDLAPSGTGSSRSSSSAYRRRMQWLLNPQSSTDGDDIGSRKTRNKSVSKPELLSSACYERGERCDKSVEELRHSRLTQPHDKDLYKMSTSNSSESFRSSQKKFDHIPRAQELMAMRMTKTNYANEKPKLPVPNGVAPQAKPRKHKHHKHHKSSRSKDPNVEYSGVYEKELDSLLECDELQNCDSFDEASHSDADNGNAVYTARYDRDVNTWTTYTMVHIDTQGYSDEQLSQTTEATSDILNDNINATCDSFGIQFTETASVFPAS